MEKKKTVRLNIPIDIDLNVQLESEAEKMGISKAGFVRVVMYDYFKQKEALKVVSDFDKFIEVLEKAKIQK